MTDNDAQRAVDSSAAQVPTAGSALADLHLGCLLQSIVAEGSSRTQNAIYSQLFGDSEVQVAADWEVEHSIFVRLVKLLKTSLEDEVVEEFVHCQHSSCSVD